MRLVKLAITTGIVALAAAMAVAQTPQPVRVGGAITAPARIKDVAPVYPADALAAGVRGVVILEATIGVDGTVTDAAILRHVALLDQAALDAVRQWVFRPTLLNGVPVPVIMTVTVNFTQSDTPAPPPPPPTTPQVSGVTSNMPAMTTAGRGSATASASRSPSVESFPAVTRVVNPAYPQEARAAGVTGTVTLDVTVDDAGAVTSAVVTESVPALDDVSVDAARQWLFKPTTLNGVPTTHFAIGFTFTAQGGVQGTLRPLTSARAASVSQAAAFAPASPGAPLRVGGSIQAPKKIVDVASIYPAEALQAGITGVVIMEITIGPDGRVTNAAVLRHIAELDRAALDAVKQWRFEPTMVNGVAVPVVMTVTVNFVK